MEGCGCPVDTSVQSTEAPTEATAETLSSSRAKTANLIKIDTVVGTNKMQNAFCALHSFRLIQCNHQGESSSFATGGSVGMENITVTAGAKICDVNIFGLYSAMNKNLAVYFP